MEFSIPKVVSGFTEWHVCFLHVVEKISIFRWNNELLRAEKSVFFLFLFCNCVFLNIDSNVQDGSKLLMLIIFGLIRRCVAYFQSNSRNFHISQRQTVRTNMRFICWPIWLQEVNWKEIAWLLFNSHQVQSYFLPLQMAL